MNVCNREKYNIGWMGTKGKNNSQSMLVQIISMWTVDSPQAKILSVTGMYVTTLHWADHITNEAEILNFYETYPSRIA